MIKLKQQMERIVDEADDDLIDVIIQLEFDRAHTKEFAKTAGDIMAQRRMALSSRDLLPFQFSKSMQTLFNGNSIKSNHKRLQATATSMALAKMQHKIEPFKPLLDHDIVKKVLARMSSSMISRNAADMKPLTFWTSRSVLLSMTKDEINELCNNDLKIKSLNINRKLSTPSILKTKELEIEVNNILVSTWGLEKIKALAAWGAYNAYGEGVTIGLLDTGVDSTHPDLIGKIAYWAEFDSMGKKIENSNPHDSEQHGTHCAGTLVGGNASTRFIGVAPRAKLAVALVLNGKYGGTDAQVLAGIDWAVDNNVDIISMSLGGLVIDAETPPTYTDAIMSCAEVGIPVIAAIGNEGHQTSGLPGNDPLAFSVGATDSTDRIAGFSGGRTQIILNSDIFSLDQLPMSYSKPDVSAPGVGVRSSVPGGTWEIFSGTSMATPHVAGAVALLLSATNIKQKVPADKKVFLIQNLISSSVEELGESGQDHRYGFGRIDVLRAIDFAKNLGY